MLHLLRQLVKRRVAVGFVVGRVVEAGRLVGIAGVDVAAFDYPDAHTFLAACIHVTGIFNGHLRICGMQAAHMFVVEALFASDKYFPKRPFIAHIKRIKVIHDGLGSGAQAAVAVCFCALLAA